MKKSGGRFAFFAARQKEADTAVFQTAPALVLRPVPDRKEWKDPMKDPLIIRENRDFVRLYKRGKSQVDPLLVTYALKSRRSCTRVGVTASKKVGGAVQRNRAKRVIRAARQVSMYIVREITQMSMATIGDEFGNRDHSTVVYAIQQVQKNMEKDQHFKETVDDIIKNIRTL